MRCLRAFVSSSLTRLRSRVRFQGKCSSAGPEGPSSHITCCVFAMCSFLHCRLCKCLAHCPTAPAHPVRQSNFRSGPLASRYCRTHPPLHARRLRSLCLHGSFRTLMQRLRRLRDLMQSSRPSPRHHTPHLASNNLSIKSDQREADGAA